jgi:hypothetical protein
VVLKKAFSPNNLYNVKICYLKKIIYNINQ